MIRLMTCLFLMLWILYLMHRYDGQLGWILVFWMLPASWLQQQVPDPCVIEALVIEALAVLVFFQDYKTFYFGRTWLVLLLAIVGWGWSKPIGLVSRFLAMSFGLVLVPFCQKGKIGSADVLAMMAMGFALGFERMLAALLIACCSALGYALLTGQTMVPFLSFLAYGFVIACYKGYTLLEKIEQALLAS